MSRATGNYSHTFHAKKLAKRIVGVIAMIVLTSHMAFADAPLKTTLELDSNQAQIVGEIQKRYRAEKRSIRQVLNRESRKLRRAKSANDAETVAKLNDAIADLEQEMTTSILNEDEEIRGYLSGEQLDKFENYVTKRNNMVGSSRDVKVL